MTDQRNWVIGIVFGPMFVAAVSAFFVGLFASGSLLWRAPGPKWSFDSWATNFTAVAAAVGAVLGSSNLPETSQKPLSGNTFSTLALFFGLLVVAGPFLFQSIRRPPRTVEELSAGYGWNLTLLIACAVTFAAVVGELVTLSLLFWQLLVGGTWANVAIAAASFAGLIALWYFLTTVRVLVRTHWELQATTRRRRQAQDLQFAIRAASRDEIDTEAEIEPLPATRWSLL
jgi:hypothetical protein